MKTDFTLKSCERCGGRGLVSSDESRSSCPTCGGDGLYLEDIDRTKFSFKLPALLGPSAASHHKVEKVVRYTASLSCLALFLVLLSISITQAEQPLDLLWHHGILNALVGLSGIGAMSALALFERHETSRLSLHDLDSKKATNLLTYSNPRVVRLVEQAAELAAKNHLDEITDELFFSTLLKQSRIELILARLEHGPIPMQEEADLLVAHGNVEDPKGILVSPDVKERLYQAFGLAVKYDFPYVDLEDILLAYAVDPKKTSGVFENFMLGSSEIFSITRWFAEDQERARQWAFWLERGRRRPKNSMNRSWTSLPTPYLDQYGIDVTVLSSEGRVPTAMIRKGEIQRAIEVLGSSSQNNVLLVGEEGVGKRSILGGIALRMVEGNVPDVLQDKRLVELDLPTLLSSGKPEESTQLLLDEIAQAGNVILAIPDAQVLVTEGKSSLDPSTLLSNALAKGVIQVICITSYPDYHKYIERNSQLTSQLSIVEVKPATQEQTLEILEEQVPSLEARYKVLFTYQALHQAVVLGEQYLSQMAAPSGAEAILGDAASAVQASKEHWVTAEDVEKAVEDRTDMPVRKATGEEADNLLNLEDELHKRVIGQDIAISTVANALRRSRAGLSDKKRPIACLLFVGPTGVGKTETAKAVADIYFGEKSHFFRLDMSEYADAESISKLIGSPIGGTSDHGEGGALTQAVREHPYSLVLLDEIEKASPEVLNLFLQLLDDGRLTENSGRTVHFNNCIIIATSNAGSQEIIRLVREQVETNKLPEQILSLLQQHFKPEFLNRFDAIVPYMPLASTQLGQVTELMLHEVVTKAAEQGITLTFAPDAIAKITQLGYDPRFGARPLRRTIQDKVEGLLAKMILEGQVQPGSTLQITGDMIQ